MPFGIYILRVFFLFHLFYGWCLRLIFFLFPFEEVYIAVIWYMNCLGFTELNYMRDYSIAHNGNLLGMRECEMEHFVKRKWRNLSHPTAQLIALKCLLLMLMFSRC